MNNNAFISKVSLISVNEKVFSKDPKSLAIKCKTLSVPDLKLQNARSK